MVDLAALADAGAFVSHEHQSHLDAAFELTEWSVDPVGATCTVRAGGSARTWSAHFIGTSSPEEGTWSWSWASSGGAPGPFIRRARGLRALGAREGIPELTTAALPLEPDLPVRLLAAAKAVAGPSAHHAVPTGNGGTLAWLLLESPDLELPEPGVTRAVGVITSGLAAGGVRDHRLAVTAWAEQRGVRLETLAPDLVRAVLPDGAVEVRFDDADRIMNLRPRLGRSAVEGAAVPDPSLDAADPSDDERQEAGDGLTHDGPTNDGPTDDGVSEPAAGRGLLRRLLRRR